MELFSYFFSSETLIDIHGHSWRLKLYPNGTKNDGNLSLFLDIPELPFVSFVLFCFVVVVVVVGGQIWRKEHERTLYLWPPLWGPFCKLASFSTPPPTAQPPPLPPPSSPSLPLLSFSAALASARSPA